MPQITGIAPTKLASPASSSTEVLRTRVLEILAHRGRRLRVILFSAPAGFGKTTAMAQLHKTLQAGSHRCAWVTLDHADNDAPRFLACLSEAVLQLGGRQRTPSSDDARTTSLDAGLIAAGLLQQISQIHHPFGLFLDDFDEITEPAVLHLTRELINHLPEGSVLILASRSAPQLGLGRLRAMGYLAEIGEKELRFSPEEAKTFLNDLRQLHLSERQVLELHDRTEGWIAAIWLASSALLYGSDKAELIAGISGSDRVIAQYLTEDVFENLPARLQGFLLRTCITDEMTDGLCDALTEQGNSKETLEEIEGSNLFIKVVDRGGRFYRYHKLFLQFLRQRLARELSQEVNHLHQVAANWYQSTGSKVQAIDHWIEAGRWEAAIRLIETAADPLLRAGRMQLLARWFQRLPAASWRPNKYLSLIAAWALCFTRGPFDAQKLHQGIRIDGNLEPELLSHYFAQRVTLLAMMDQLEDAYTHGLQARARVRDDDSFASSVFANQMAYICRVMGDSHESNRMLASAKSGDSVGDFNRMYCESVEGLIDLEEGRAREAASRFRLAAAACAELQAEPVGSAWAGVLHAGVFYQRNELDSAENLLRVHVPLARAPGMADHLIAGYRMLSRIAFARGQVDEAFNWLAELEVVGQERKLVRVTCGAKLERARLFLLQGNHEGSRDELDRANDVDVWSRERKLRLPAHDVEFWELADLRWQIHTGNAKQCIEVLERLGKQAVSEHRHRRALKIMLLTCIAEQQAKTNVRVTAAKMERVLKKACAEQLVRTILDEGPIITDLLRGVCQTTSASDEDRELTQFHPFLNTLRDAFSMAAPMNSEVSSSRLAHGLEPLTPKEQRILNLLSEGHSNSALAQKLFVSTSTVRTHLRNINAKLNVRSRTEAVAVGRKIGALR